MSETVDIAVCMCVCMCVKSNHVVLTHAQFPAFLLQSKHCDERLASAPYLLDLLC